MRYFLIINLLFMSLIARSQNKNGMNLSQYIREIERQYQITVSYSPSVTDTIYPEVSWSVLPAEKQAAELLSELLRNTGYGVASIKGLIYLYKEPVKPITPLTTYAPAVFRPKRDTVRVPAIQNDNRLLRSENPEMKDAELTGVSTWDYLSSAGIRPDRMKWNVYSNLLLLGTGSLNVGTSFGLTRKWTLGGMISYNPWKYGDARIKHIMLRPEARYWLCDNFGGHFFGVNLTYARFNAGGINLPFMSDNIKNNRYQGNLGGLGISYGHSWILGKRINLEVEVGVGVNHAGYSKYPCTDCGQKVKSGKKTFVSPNKFAVNLVYVLK